MPSLSSPVSPAIAINTVTNGADNLTILEGSNITWTYTVTNTGNVGLSNVTVRDDRFPGSTMAYVSGDVDQDGVLDVGEVWTFQQPGTAGRGDYQNVGTVTGVYRDSEGRTEEVSATDPSNYFGAYPGVCSLSFFFSFWSHTFVGLFCAQCFKVMRGGQLSF